MQSHLDAADPSLPHGCNSLRHVRDDKILSPSTALMDTVKKIDGIE